MIWRKAKKLIIVQSGFNGDVVATVIEKFLIISELKLLLGEQL